MAWERDRTNFWLQSEDSKVVKPCHRCMLEVASGVCVFVSFLWVCVVTSDQTYPWQGICTLLAPFTILLWCPNISKYQKVFCRGKNRWYSKSKNSRVLQMGQQVLGMTMCLRRDVKRCSRAFPARIPYRDLLWKTSEWPRWDFILHACKTHQEQVLDCDLTRVHTQDSACLSIGW